METTLAQIFGGVFGLAIAWLINYYYTMRETKIAEEQKIQHQQELERFKNEFKKSVK